MADLGALLPQEIPGALAPIRGALSGVKTEPDILQQAISQYPYLAGKNISYVRSPDESSDGRLLEMWAPNDAGWDWKGKRYDRPKNLPLDSHGVEIFSDKVRPIDILGDYVSHHAINKDENLKSLYSKFIDATPPEMMRQRYDYHKTKLGEDREYTPWLRETGLPELFRGYTFNQFGDNPERIYNPEQLKVLNQVKSYLGVK